MADALIVVGAVDGVAGVDGHLLDAAPVAAAPALVVRARRRPRPDQRLRHRHALANLLDVANRTTSNLATGWFTCAMARAREKEQHGWNSSMD